MGLGLSCLQNPLADGKCMGYRFFPHFQSFWALLGAGVVVVLGFSAFTALAVEKRVAAKMLGSLSCSSASCHGNQPGQSSRPRPREEYLRWLQADPHARAKETLASERYQAILARLNQRSGGQVEAQVQARCVRCHDPLGMSGGVASNSITEHGIGCESCHGNAEKWLARHYERGIERSELISLGMIDTTSLETRGQQCASCHVGSADQDMNHEMIAAGHPPLRFELSAYHDLIPHKHWDDTRERLEKREFQVQLWAAGQAASAQASLELLAARCGQTENWPELAEYNCFACHQRLRAPIDLPDAHGQVGRPNWSRWNTTFPALVKPNAASVANETSLEKLRTLFGESFPPDPAQVRTASLAAHLELSILSKGDALTGEKLLQTLVASWKNETQDSDWEVRCQQYLALLAAERSYRDELAKHQFFARISQEEYNRRLAEHQSLAAELVVVRTWLQFETGSATSVLRDEPLQFHEHRQQIGPRLKSIADKMHERLLELP
jgi:hypothetical protein